MESAHRQFVLLVPPANADDGPALQVIPVPEGPSFLATGSPSPRLLRRKPARAANPICLEPVVVNHRPYLLMLQGSGALRCGVRQNGQPAWPLTLLRVGDEVQNEGKAFFVSSRRDRSVFPAEDRHVGTKCPLCTVEIVHNTMLYSCGSCGVLLHCEDERWPDDERLECAKLASTCPTCHQAIDFSEGIEWEPEL
jgi:hypothetical protein